MTQRKQINLTSGYGVHECLGNRALELAKECGVREAAKKCGIGKSTLYTWRRAAMQPRCNGTPMQRDVAAADKGRAARRITTSTMTTKDTHP
jgi:transposase-like protein